MISLAVYVLSQFIFLISLSVIILFLCVFVLVGLCGVFDGQSTNDLTRMDGTIDTLSGTDYQADAFTLSWRYSFISLSVMVASTCRRVGYLWHL